MTDTAMSPRADASDPGQPPVSWRRRYLLVLTWAFMLLTAARLVAYAPTVIAN